MEENLLKLAFFSFSRDFDQTEIPTFSYLPIQLYSSRIIKKRFSAFLYDSNEYNHHVAGTPVSSCS